MLTMYVLGCIVLTFLFVRSQTAMTAIDLADTTWKEKIYITLMSPIWIPLVIVSIVVILTVLAVVTPLINSRDKRMVKKNKDVATTDSYNDKLKRSGNMLKSPSLPIIQPPNWNNS